MEGVATVARKMMKAGTETQPGAVGSPRWVVRQRDKQRGLGDLPTFPGSTSAHHIRWNGGLRMRRVGLSPPGSKPTVPLEPWRCWSRGLLVSALENRDAGPGRPAHYKARLNA